VPAGRLTGAITMSESLIWTLTCVLEVSGGIDESVTVTVIGYAPAVPGLPESCPDTLNVRPGGRGPDSVQLKGAVPPEAANM
jgi:hypothetical protein